MTSNPIIRSIGVFIPENQVSNVDFLDQFAITDAFLNNKLGIQQRTIKNNGDKTSDLCLKAYDDLCKNIKFDSAQIELVCVVTQNPDQKIPHTSAIVHQKLGLGKRCMTFDISQGCAGFTHGLSIVSALMSRLHIHSALLFTCDPYSNIVDSQDKNTTLLFGDAATVTLLTNEKEAEGFTLVDTHFGTVPDSYHCLTCDDKLYMNGHDVLNYALKEVPGNIHALLTANHLAVADVDLFVLHQASKILIDSLRDLLNLDEKKVPFDILNIGNTVSSSIPIMLQKYISNKSKRQIVLSGFGVGFSFASSLIKLINHGD